MRRKVISLILALSLHLSLAAPAFADVTTFGFDQWMSRYAKDLSEAPILAPSWVSNGDSNVGMSYSQPLILSGLQFGVNTPVVITAATNTITGGAELYGWKCPQSLSLNGMFQQNDPAWSVPLAGDGPTASHPTLVTINGKKIVFIGTAHDSIYGYAVFEAFDVTDAFATGQAKQVLFVGDPNATDIVSAPLVTQWNGHWIAVYTTGNTGRVCVVTNLDKIGAGSFDPTNVQFSALQLDGRTSSSPIGVMYSGGNPTGFAVGVDGSPGQVYVFRFDDILSTDGNGNVVLSGQNQYFKHDFSSGGIAASFSASNPDGNTIYFGDTNSDVYSLDVPTNTLNWKNTDVAGNFSNRSPALSPNNNVYFPAGTGPGNTGTVISIDRSTGQTSWTKQLQYGCQTAPAIWPTNIIGATPSIFIGNSAGFIGQLDPSNDGNVKNAMQLTDASGTSYASGITGEISLGDGYMVASTNNGLLAWSVVSPPDMQAFSLDPGCPKVNGIWLAQPGQTYTATLKYNCNIWNNGGAPSLSDFPGTPVGAFGISANGATAASLLDGSGSPLPSAPVTSMFGSAVITSQIVDIKPGQQLTYTFKWTADPSNPFTELDAAINLIWPKDSPRMTQVWDEQDLTNNSKGNNVVVVPITVDLPNLVAEVVTPSINEADPGQSFTATFTVKNASNKDFQGVPVGLYLDGQLVTLYDENNELPWQDFSGGKTNQIADFAPGQSRTFSAKYLTAIQIGQSVLTGVVNTNPVANAYQEASLQDNITGAVVKIKTPSDIPAGGNEELTFQAQGQPSILDTQMDAWGNPLGPVIMPPGTARWTDIVTATLKPKKRVQSTVFKDFYGNSNTPDYSKVIAPPPPPAAEDEPCTNYTVLDSWEIIDAQLSYPKQNPDYTFGHPLPPYGSVTVDMNRNGNNADVKFQEMWAEDGAEVYDPRTGQKTVPDAQNYTITAEYTVRVHYTVYEFEYVCSLEECWCILSRKHSDYRDYNYSASGPLYVDGTGVNCLGM